MITQDLLKKLFTYDPETGYFYNRTSRGRAAEGSRAGSPSGHGYRKITVLYDKYYEHQLAWLYMTGEWPGEIDHIDGDGYNNSFVNLRVVTRSQNNMNSKRKTGSSGLRGAYLDRRTMNWYSQIQLGGIVFYLGNFETAEQANAAFLAAVEKYHGEYAFHNRPSEIKEAS